MCALERFKNLPNKMVVVLHENERRGTEVCRTLTEKGFGNIYLLTGGIQQFYIDYPGLVQGNNIPEYAEYKYYIETSIRSPKKKNLNF